MQVAGGDRHLDAAATFQPAEREPLNHARVEGHYGVARLLPQPLVEMKPSIPQIAQISVMTADLPFRFWFDLALARRRSTINGFVNVTLEDGSEGYKQGPTRLRDRHDRRWSCCRPEGPL
jgi:hypothetical protein